MAGPDILYKLTLFIFNIHKVNTIISYFVAKMTET